MLDYIRDPAWQFVGAIFALVAIIATILIFVLQRQRKRLAYELVSINRLLTVKEELEGKLQVIYEGQPTRDICLLIVKLINNGNVAISSTDYEREVSIGTGAASKILSAAITEVEPQGLAIELTIQDSSIQLSRTLLNPRDSIALKVLVSDFGGKISVDGRIVGVRKVESVGGNGTRLVLMLIAVVALLLGTFMVVVSTPRPVVPQPRPIGEVVGGVMVVLSYFLMVYALVKKQNLRRLARALVRAIFRPAG